MEKAIISNCRKEPEDEQRSIKGKRKKVDLFVFLPDDILSDILKRLPDAFLRYKAKHVCRRWMDLISNMPDRASFIIQNSGNLTTVRHVGIREEGEEGLQVKVQDLDVPRIGNIRSWGIEFLLIESEDKGKNRSLYVYNLITREGSYLPKCNASCGGYCFFKCGVAISFDGFKGIDKVVHLFPGPPIECHILILTKDIVSSKWKKIQVPNCMNGEGWFFYHSPVTVQGRYIHWKAIADDKRLVSMDMVKEEIVDMIPPMPLHNIDYTIFEMGGSLALFGGVSQDKAEIWILKDFQRNNWEKLHLLNLEKWYHKSFPVCGVMSRSNRYIILECNFYEEGMWYYDLKNGALKKLDIHIGINDYCMVHSSPPSF